MPPSVSGVGSGVPASAHPVSSDVGASVGGSLVTGSLAGALVEFTLSSEAPEFDADDTGSDVTESLEVGADDTGSDVTGAP